MKLKGMYRLDYIYESQIDKKTIKNIPGEWYL